MKRLYVVVRDDLPPGLQMAQACHVAFSYGSFGSEDGAHDERPRTGERLAARAA